MPAVLVHGVPDTHRLWDKLRVRLSRRDVLTPNLPGFGVPTPPGFHPTKEAYVAWLIAEIERVGTPVHLVGHDWGSLLVQRLVSLRPDLIRTWAVGDGPIDREYVWHDLAQQWQTPGVGEAIMAVMGGDALAEGLAGAGVPADDARVTASHMDERMKECILGLYRSAVHVGEEWEDDVASIDRPALVLWSRDDPYVASRFAERLAARVRGELVLLEGCGHWWPLERPAEAAAALEAFWRRHA
jgi:pimeloyl-ACP methyl ester carboxylesterase